MRKAFDKTSFIYGLNDEFIGISLGYDFCAEHEWGIAGIKSLLGIPIELTEKNIGIDYRTITKFDEENVIFQEFDGKVNKKKQKLAILIVDRPWNKEQYKEFPKNLPHDLRSYEIFIDRVGLMCAWDKDSFGIIVLKEHIDKLRQLYESLKIKDACIGLFGGGAFENAHLTVAIKSKMPEETLDMLKKSDTSSLALIKVSKEINLEEKARSKRKDEPFIHISVKWIDYENAESREKKKKNLNTKYDVQAWVNGSNDNYGWFTVEQVLKWIDSDKKKVADVT
jgi:hypothetical protein